MIERLYAYRFELFLSTQVLILFGILIVPPAVFGEALSSVFFQVNLLAGVLMLAKSPRTALLLTVFLLVSLVVNFMTEFGSESSKVAQLSMLGMYFSFQLIVTFAIIKQVWYAQHIDRKVILGLMSGYIALGLVAFFLFMTIEAVHSNSLTGLGAAGDGGAITEQILYFSYITMMTIGYGDMAPIAPVAKKASILIGLMGQFYLVILTAIVVGKYIGQNNSESQ